jgi:hypothetical protein
MGLNTQQYVKKPNRLEVVEVTRENLTEVAAWCGGQVNDIRNVLSDSLNSGSIGVPSLYGAIDAEVGNFVAREVETGKFSVMSREHLDNEYQRVGVRQDGIFGKRG